MDISHRRKQAYLDGLAQAGLDVREDLIEYGDFKIDSGRHALEQLLARSHPPTAVFAANDLMAIGAVLHAQDLGYRVPDDIAIMGYDNMQEAILVRPQLTTVDHNASRLGEELARLLFERIGNYSGKRRVVNIPQELVVRESA